MKFFLSFLFISICFSVHGQAIYTLKYRSPVAGDTTIYNAYFSVSSNGMGFVRVRSGDGKTITEMEIIQQYASDANGIPDTTMLVYEGTNPVIVKGMKTKFTPVSFWFKINNELLFDPWGVTTSLTGPAPVKNNFLAATFIKSQDIVKYRDTLRTFFADSSAYVQNLFGPRSKGGELSPDVRKNTRLRLIVVASTKDPHLLQSPLIDANKIIAAFRKIAIQVLRIGFSVDSVYGDKYSKAAVEKLLQNLKPGKNDIVVFYYSGHGFTDREDPKRAKKEYPFLDLRDPSKTLYRKDLKTETMNIEDIFDTIVSKGARFNLVLSDCCNDTVAAPKIVGTNRPGEKGETSFSFENVKALFMSKVPMNYLMTAASKDERATVTPYYNSYFTSFFISSLNTYSSTEKGVSHWNRVLADTQNQTKFFAGKVPCPKGAPCPDGKMLRQTPKMLSKF